MSIVRDGWSAERLLVTGGAPTHEVNDFQFVSVGEFGGLPVRARDDVAIQFHCDAISLKGKCLNQVREGDTCELLIFSIDN